jgi:BioD-like phosphotransacetylase family protein
MVTLHIASTERFSGKSALCIGLGRAFQRRGYALGYLKPVSMLDRVLPERTYDEDAGFMQQALGLSEPLEVLAPVTLTSLAVEAILKGESPVDYRERLKAAYERVANGKDVLILEGGGNLRDGYLLGLSPPLVSELLQAQELVVVKYHSDTQMVDDALASRAILDDSLLGVVFNVVPRQRLPFVKQVVQPFLAARGVTVLAALPRERVLSSVGVSELVDGLSSELLCGEGYIDELVEHLMVGAMNVEAALRYFRRKPNKAVITGGDRPDIQLAALETSTKCLILTGNLEPNPIILARAEEIGVPVLLVKEDTLTTVQKIESFFGKTRFHQPKKIQCFERILAEHFDFAKLYEALGL